MPIVIVILKITLIAWVCLFILMLPVYFIRKKLAPDNKRNTLKALIILSFTVSVAFVLIMCSGLIAMYIDELQGVYR